MSANRLSLSQLSLSQSKGEFLRVFSNGFLKSLTLLFSCIQMSSDSACNLGVIFDSSLADHISSVSKSYFLSDSTKVTNRKTLGSTTAGTIAATLIHFKESYCNSFSTFLALSLIVFSWFSTLLLVLFLKLLESPLFHLFLNLYSGSKLTNTFIKKISQSPTKHYLVSPPISAVFSLSNQTLALVLLYHCHSQVPRSFLSTQNH
jgi:hypothetical protein